MSDELNDEPTLPLPDPQEMTDEATYDAPSILMRAEVIQGFPIFTVREGQSRQVQMTTRIKWTDEPVEPPPELFVQKAQNVINFAKQRLAVINDETTLGELQLPPSVPTATEYRNQVGKETLIHFVCTRDLMESKRLGRAVYKSVYNSIILP